MSFGYLWVLEWPIYTRIGFENLIRDFVPFHSPVHGLISEPESDPMVCIYVQLDFFKFTIPAKIQTKIGAMGKSTWNSSSIILDQKTTDHMNTNRQSS